MVGNGQRSVSNPGIKINISALLVGTALTLATEDLAFAQDKTVKIGALSDQSGTLCRSRRTGIDPGCPNGG